MRFFLEMSVEFYFADGCYLVYNLLVFMHIVYEMCTFLNSLKFL